MGWKSTIDISRQEAIQAIMQSIDKTPYGELSDEELESMMYSLGIGNDMDKPYCGFNFNIIKDE